MHLTVSGKRDGSHIRPAIVTEPCAYSIKSLMPLASMRTRRMPYTGGGRGWGKTGSMRGWVRENVGGKGGFEGLTRIRLFLYLGLKDEAVAEVLRLRNRVSDDKEMSIMLASILSSLGEYSRAMYTIRPYIPSLTSNNGYSPDNRLWPLVYPAGYR